MVLREEIMELEYFPENEDGKQQAKNRETLRPQKVGYQDEQNRYFELIPNSMDCTAEEVAFLYRKHRGIELLFKKMKQNFQRHYFYGENENAIRTRIADDGNPKNGKHEESVFRCGNIGKDTLDQLAGCLGSFA
mgnify:CR=1 FL=1